MKKLFGSKESKKPSFIVTEGIEGTWHYHISREECFTRSLCNERVMRTNMQLKDWGIVTHLKEKYCPECLKFYQENLDGKARDK